MTLQIKNPHSLIAALNTRPKDVLEIVLPKSLSNNADKHKTESANAWSQVARIAREKGVKLNYANQPSQSVKKRSSDDEGGRLGAFYGVLNEKASISIEELFKSTKSSSVSEHEKHGLWIALDSLQDPHNIGAIFRIAAFFGVKGILLTQERSAPMSATVYDVASGGVEHIPFSIQVNLQRAFEVAKESGLWILGTSEHAHDSIQSVQKDRSWLLVLGNEERGMRRLTEESCDVLCKIPCNGKVTSLNVSVAAGIFISHLCN